MQRYLIGCAVGLGLLDADRGFRILLPSPLLSSPPSPLLVA
jgi:hypothetical protein